MTEELHPPVRVLEETIGDSLPIFCGYTEEFVEQLVVKSRQEHIRATTRRDAEERFVNNDAFHRWFKAKTPVLYMLADKTRSDLGGILWHRAAKYPGGYNGLPPANHTFGIRLYEGYRGKGLARPFMRAALKDYIVTSNDQLDISNYRGIWLETDQTNKEALTPYLKFGYEVMANDNGRLLMVLSPEQTLRVISSAG